MVKKIAQVKGFICKLMLCTVNTQPQVSFDCRHEEIVTTPPSIIHPAEDQPDQTRSADSLSSCCKWLEKIVSKRIHKTSKYDKHTTSEKSVRVSVDKSLGGTKTSRSSVSVSVVNGAGAVDSGSVGGLVEDGGGLVLAVAVPGKGSELVEEGAAVGDDVGRREGVGEDTGGAGAVDVGAVGASDAASGGAAVVGDSTEAGGDGGTGGGLEELLELGG